MGAHPNVDTVNRMTKAIFDQDHDALARSSSTISRSTFVAHTRWRATIAGSAGSWTSWDRSSR